MRHFCVLLECLIAFIVLPVGVLGCPPPGEIPPFEVVALGQGNSTRHELRKRYYTLKGPAEDGLPENAPNTLWANNLITYCYNSQADFDAIEPFMQGAWGSWEAQGPINNDAGDNTNALRFVGMTPNKLCGGNPQGQFLRVSSNTNQVAATSIGYKVDGSSRMNFDPSATYGTLDIESNLAHEIGHAWGMVHEHQRPMAWLGGSNGFPDGTAAPGAELIEFNCANLADYQVKVGNDPVSLACGSATAAQNIGFSAEEILPFSGYGPAVGGGSVQLMSDGGPGFDWDSIMLYPSRAGGIPNNDANNPNDPRAIVMTKAGTGNWWGPNTNPSDGDATRLAQIYRNPATLPPPNLVSNDGNPKKGFFESLFGCLSDSSTSD